MNKRAPEYSIIEYMILLINNYDKKAFSDVAKNIDIPNEQYLDTARKIKEFIDEIPGGFLIYNADGDQSIVYANKALLKIFRCDTLEEFQKLTGNSFCGIVHPDDLECVEKSITEQIKYSGSERFDYVEYRIIRKDGIVRWVEDFGRFVHSETAGNYFYVFIGDATEKVTRRMADTATLINESQKKNERLETIIREYDKERKLIRQSELQRLKVIEGLSVNYDSILYVDIPSDMVLPYRLSERLVVQFEYQLQVREFSWFLKNYVDVWVHPDDKARVAEETSIEYMKKTLSTQRTYYINYRCIKNGEIQYIQLRMVNVGSPDEEVAQIVMGYRNVDKEVLHEIEQNKLLEEALKRAKHAADAKNTFLSNMSHDMRTPLNALFGYVSLARKDLKNPDKTADCLDKIEAAGNNILDLVEKVLTLSEAESPEFSIVEEKCDIVEAMKELFVKYRKKAETKNISFSLDVSAVANKNVYADKPKLQQVISHIINNAIMYTDNGGIVDITVTEQPRNGEYASFDIAVRDTGIGISEENIKNIFEPFERIKNTTLSGMYGVGLGLTIAKQIIDSMGGTISIQSTYGKGSTFTTTVCLRIAEAPSCYETQMTADDLRGKRILIVEDNEINMEIETEILEGLGFLIEGAENGQVALDKIRSSAPGYYSFILMDIQMPVMDGRAAARAIRKLDDPSLANIPIVALSANAFDTDKRESLAAGMNAHLTKPLDVSALLNTFSNVIKQ